MNDRAADNAPTAREERVAVVHGDRLCINCSYNLTGQPVLREPHYDLLIIRCPECSTIASAQEYPLTGRWTGRLATAVAIAWFVILIAALSGLIGPMLGLTIGFSAESSGKYEEVLRDGYAVWLAELYPDQDTSRWWTFNETFEQWYVTQDPAQLLAQQGGFLGAIDWFNAIPLFVPVILAFALGLLLSLAIIHRRRWSIMLLVTCFAIIAWTILAVVRSQFNEATNLSADDVAMLRIGVPLIGVMFGLEWISALCGVQLGRSIARGLVCALLPPRFRNSLAILWTTDGLEVPSHDPNATRWTRAGREVVAKPAPGPGDA